MRGNEAHINDMAAPDQAARAAEIRANVRAELEDKLGADLARGLVAALGAQLTSRGSG